MRKIYTTLVFAICALSVHAQDRVFARTYQSNVISKGSFDLEYITTLRTGKNGDYSPYQFGRYLDIRLELEFGLGKNIQTAFYLNTSNFRYALKNEAGFLPDMNSETDISFSNEWKFKLSDPVANGFGSALYAEITAGTGEYEFEGKLILDKRINNELFALNLTGELEFETELEQDGLETENELEMETPFELTFAYMHFFKPTFGVGLELRNHNQAGKEHGWENSVVFGGPSVFFNQGKFFGVLNVLPQIGNFKKTHHAPGGRDLDGHENLELRLLIGYSF